MDQRVGPGSRYEVLRGMLANRRAEIQEKLRELRDGVSAASSGKDSEEHAVELATREMELAIVQMGSDNLRAIDEALQRLERGSYGQCGDCDEEIAAARLRALPFAVLCRECQEAREASAPASIGVPGFHA